MKQQSLLRMFRLSARWRPRLFSVVGLSLLSLLQPVQAYTLTDYIERKCMGEINVELEDGSIAQCLTPDQAVVFAPAKHWVEALQEAIELGEKTNRLGTVYLIGHRRDPGYRKARRLVYEAPLPIEIDLLFPFPQGI